MKAAVKSIIITPKIGISIAGNVRKDDISRGVHDELQCNMILLDDEQGTKVCYLGLDLVKIELTEAIRLREGVSKSLNIPYENIIVNATHTHSGPSVTTTRRNSMSKETAEYLKWLVEYISINIGGLNDMLEDVTLKIGKSEVHDLSFNRRLILKDGSVKMNFEEFEIEDVVRATGPIDPELLVISIYNNDNKMKALMVNFTLHPAILVGHDWLISRDFIHYMDEEIKDEYGRDVVVYFANGTEGNVNHLNYQDKNQDRGFKETNRIGTKLGKYIIKNIAQSKTEKIDNISCISKKIKLPMRKLMKKDLDWAQMVIKRDEGMVLDQLDGIPDLVYALNTAEYKRTTDPFMRPTSHR